MDVCTHVSSPVVSPLPLRRWRAPSRLVLLLAMACAMGATVSLGSAPALALNKSEVFERCAPATALVVVMGPRGAEIGSGAVVDSRGLLITNYHVVADAPRASSFAVFLYDPSERVVEDDLRTFIESHRERALTPRILRIDKENDLALLQLPERKGGYPTIAWGDSDNVRIGQDVVAIGNPQGLAWTLTSGSISAIRKNALQTETAINPGNSGGPLLDMDGRLVGINTWIVRNAQSLGFARPVNLVRAFTEQRGDLSHAVLDAPKRAEGRPSTPSVASMSALVQRVFTDVETRFPGPQGKRVVCALFSAFTYSGRTVLMGVGEVAWLNDTLDAALQATPQRERAKTVEYIEQSFPLLAVSGSGRLWVRSGTRYFDVGPAVAMDVDDVTGQVYATNNEGEVLAYNRSDGKWQAIGIGKVNDIEASNGVLYVLDRGGMVHAHSGNRRSTLSARPVKGSLQATRGMLYVLDDKDGSLFRWRSGRWDNGGDAIATGVREVRAFGTTWYGLDGDGRVYSGDVSSYIDREGDLVGIWLMADDLLGLSRDGTLYLWNNKGRRWRALSQ